MYHHVQMAGKPVQRVAGAPGRSQSRPRIWHMVQGMVQGMVHGGVQCRGGGVGGGPWSGIWSNHGQGPCCTWLRQRRLVRSSMYQCMDHVLDPVLGVLRMAEPWAGPWKLHRGVVAAQRTRAGTLCWTRCPVCCIQADGTEGCWTSGWTSRFGAHMVQHLWTHRSKPRSLVCLE